MIATERDPTLVSYMDERARTEGLQNFSSRLMPADGSGLDAGSVDAMVLVETLSREQHAGELLKALASALKPGGLIVIVDSPREGQGASQTGIDADDVVGARDRSRRQASRRDRDRAGRLRDSFPEAMS